MAWEYSNIKYSRIMERYGKTYYGTYEDECKIKSKRKKKQTKKVRIKLRTTANCMAFVATK